MFTIGAFGIIMDEKKRVLLCHRRDLDLWNLPGGKVEANETPWDAVIREIKEETGLDTRITNMSGVYSKPEKDEIVFSFVCEITGSEIALNDEADGIKYFELEEFPKNTSPKQVERVRDYFADKSKIHYKIQTGPSSADLVNSGKL